MRRELRVRKQTSNSLEVVSESSPLSSPASTLASTRLPGSPAPTTTVKNEPITPITMVRTPHLRQLNVLSHSTCNAVTDAGNLILSSNDPGLTPISPRSPSPLPTGASKTSVTALAVRRVGIH